MSKKAKLHSVTSHTVKARSINSPIGQAMVAPDQMSFYLSGTEVDRCRRIPSRCCSKDSGKSQDTPEFRLPSSWGSDSLLHQNIRPYLSRQRLLACWALVPQILDCGLSLPCSLPRFKHYLSLIMPGYVSPAHTPLLNPEYAPHLPAWRPTM